MTRECRAPVLTAIADRTARAATVQTLHEAGFEVWEAQDYDEAVTMLHTSPRGLVVLVDRELLSVLSFAAADRRLADHHVYIALGADRGPVEDQGCQQFPCLTLLRIESATRSELVRTVAKAAQLHGSEPVGRREMVMR